jgi:hypothetical protein
MTKSSSLDDNHHLVRHIRESEIDDQEGHLLAFPQAFALRPGETYLSTGWLEFFDGAIDTQLSGIAAMILRPALSRCDTPWRLVVLAIFGMRVRVLIKKFEYCTNLLRTILLMPPYEELILTNPSCWNSSRKRLGAMSVWQSHT